MAIAWLLAGSPIPAAKNPPVALVAPKAAPQCFALQNGTQFARPRPADMPD